MNTNILRKLKEWRDETAKKEGVENYRVIPNSAIEEIARSLPRSKEELTSIKGIKDKKFYKYGRDIFDIIKDGTDKNTDCGNSRRMFLKDLFAPAQIIKTSERTDKIFSVGGYLDFLNDKLLKSGRARIKGEITSVDVRERVTYFSLKDPRDESVINCLIFKYNYEISGIVLEAGTEVIITADPEIYKPTGRLSLKASLIEISGEGFLKKSYDELKAKLEKDGVFCKERKRTIPKLPKIIGLITSNQGAAIGDFTSNIGNYGFKIKFINSSVEGKQAIFDLLNAIKKAKEIKDMDVLAIVRGGGSLESLQAFNNETLVRELITLRVPVVCGVGHEKDISLASLACDISVSTPTAAAFAIRESWDSAVREIEFSKDTILDAFEKILFRTKYDFENNMKYGIRSGVNLIMMRFNRVIDDIRSSEQKISAEICSKKDCIENYRRSIFNKYEKMLFQTKERIGTVQAAIIANDPGRQLRLGYSISYNNGKLTRSVDDIAKNDHIKTRLADGIVDSIVQETKKDNI